MQNIIKLRNNKRIINSINHFLEPLIINDNFELVLVDGKKNIYYNLMYALYNHHINHFIELSNLITPEEAYNILMIIPYAKKNIKNIDIETKLKIINYNYVWCRLLLYYKFHINIIKILLNNYIDYYYIEVIYLYYKMKDINIAFKIMYENKSHFYTINNIKQYYYLRIYNINHFNAYILSKYCSFSVYKIIELIKIGYNEFKYLSMAYILTLEQVEFLKFSKFGYITNEDFINNKDDIFDNVIKMNLINPDYFEPNYKKIKY